MGKDHMRTYYFPPVTPLCPRRVLAALSLLLLLLGEQIACSLAAFRLPGLKVAAPHRIHTLFLYQCYRTPQYVGMSHRGVKVEIRGLAALLAP